MSRSTIAIARSREAWSTVKPKVVASTTSPVVICPARHSSTDQATTAAVTRNTQTAWRSLIRSNARRLSHCADISWPMLCDKRSRSRCAAAKARTSPILLITSARSPVTAAARSAYRSCKWLLRPASQAMIDPRITAIAASATVRRQLTNPSTAMLLSTAAAGGIVFQASRFSIANAALPAVAMRPANAPGKRFEK